MCVLQGALCILVNKIIKERISHSYKHTTTSIHLNPAEITEEVVSSVLDDVEPERRMQIVEVGEYAQNVPMTKPGKDFITSVSTKVTIDSKKISKQLSNSKLVSSSRELLCLFKHLLYYLHFKINIV